MASTYSWTEYNGSGAANATTTRGEANWKNIDDSTTAYTGFPITAGSNSYTKYQAIVFAGTWNTLSALTYKVSTATPLDSASASAKLAVVASVVTSGTTPSASPSGDSAASTSGTSANFSNSSTPYTAGTTSTSAGGGTMYANAYRTQLQTVGTAAAGDIASVTITASWTES